MHNRNVSRNLFSNERTIDHSYFGAQARKAATIFLSAMTLLGPEADGQAAGGQQNGNTATTTDDDKNKNREVQAPNPSTVELLEKLMALGNRVVPLPHEESSLTITRSDGSRIQVPIRRGMYFPFEIPKSAAERRELIKKWYTTSPKEIARKEVPYFVWPLVELKSAKAPLPDYPDFVQHASRRKDRFQRRTLTFKAQFTSDDLVKAAKAKVVKNDPVYWKSIPAKANELDMKRWPVTAVVIQARVNGDPIASGVVDTLDSAVEEFSFRLKFTDRALMQFIDAVADDELDFSFHFVYSGHKIGYVQQSSEGTEKVRDAIKSQIESRGWGPEKPITQAQRGEFEGVVKSAIRNNAAIMGGNNPAVLALYDQTTAQIMGQLLRHKTIRGKEAKTILDEPETKAALASHLQALKQQKGWSKEEQKIIDNTKIVENADINRKGKTKGGGGGFSLDLGPLSIGGRGSIESMNMDEKVHRVIDAIRKRTGIGFRHYQDNQYFEPHEIDVSYVIMSGDNVSIGSNSFVSISLGQEGGYLPPLVIRPNVQVDLYHPKPRSKRNQGQLEQEIVRLDLILDQIRTPILAEIAALDKKIASTLKSTPKATKLTESEATVPTVYFPNAKKLSFSTTVDRVLPVRSGSRERRMIGEVASAREVPQQREQGAVVNRKLGMTKTPIRIWEAGLSIRAALQSAAFIIGTLAEMPELQPSSTISGRYLRMRKQDRLASRPIVLAHDSVLKQGHEWIERVEEISHALADLKEAVKYAANDFQRLEAILKSTDVRTAALQPFGKGLPLKAIPIRWSSMQDGWFNTGDYSLDPMISLLEELGRVRLERKHFDRNKEMREELSKKLGEILKKARTFSDPPNPDKSKIKQKRDRENTL